VCHCLYSHTPRLLCVRVCAFIRCALHCRIKPVLFHACYITFALSALTPGPDLRRGPRPPTKLFIFYFSLMIDDYDLVVRALLIIVLVRPNLYSALCLTILVICLERGADCLHVVQLMPLPAPKPHHLSSRFETVDPRDLYDSCNRSTVS